MGHPLIIGKDKLNVCSVTISECERSTQGLSFIARGDEFQKVKQKDVYLDPIFGNKTSLMSTTEGIENQVNHHQIDMDTSQLNSSGDLNPETMVQEQVVNNQTVKELDNTHVINKYRTIKRWKNMIINM